MAWFSQFNSRLDNPDPVQCSSTMLPPAVCADAARPAFGKQASALPCVACQCNRHSLAPGACRAAQLYSHLSALEQSGNLPRDTIFSRVPLVEGPLSREEMRFLECVANEVLCPVELWYQDQPAPSM